MALPKSVRRVVVPGSGTLYRKGGKRQKKGSRALRPLEKDMRRIMISDRDFFDTFLDRHKRSNQKRKDGWLRDMDKNVSKAFNKSTKRFRKMKSL